MFVCASDLPDEAGKLPGREAAQLQALRQSINVAQAGEVVAATPIDRAVLIALERPLLRARHELAKSETTAPAAELDRFLAGRGA